MTERGELEGRIAARCLRFAAVAILIAGLGGAIWIYLAAAPADNALGYDPMQSKKYLHDLELYGGEAKVLAGQIMDWFESVWHGTRLADTGACGGALVAGGWWCTAVAGGAEGAGGWARPRARRTGRDYGVDATAGSPSESIRRLAQLKKAAAWMTSEIARSSSPARRSRSTCAGPNALGVAVSATEAATMAFQRSPRSVSTPV